VRPGLRAEQHDRTQEEIRVSDQNRTFNVLFLCTGNSARSILSEALLNKRVQGQFRAFSAGSHPAGRVNPFALELLQRMGYATDRLRSKSWGEFAAPGAPELDFVFTVCDNAAGEVCPMWPGQPITAHWGVPDPAAVEGTDEQKRKAFDEAFRILERRISLFLSLPIRSLEQLVLQERLSEIGRS
jgi:protein-tyrosine-phosphatase